MADEQHLLMPLATARRGANSRNEADAAAGPGAAARFRHTAPMSDRPREPRRGLLAAGGALTVLLCTALGVAVATRANERRAFLEIVRYVPMGATIAPGDLRSVAITPAAGLGALPVSDATAVVGRHASTALEPGSLLVFGDLGSAVSLAPSAALIGTSLNADQVPLGLEPGDHVLVLLGGASSGLSGGPSTSSPTNGARGAPTNATQGAGVLAHGVVASLAVPAGATAGAGSEVVTIDLPASAAPLVAAASAASDISLAKVPAAVSPSGAAK
jgi:hypothetical protein